MDKPKPRRKVYKPTGFGDGMQPGTVEWELNRRKIRKEQREDDREWAKIQANRVPENDSLIARIASVFYRIGAYLARVSGLSR